MLKNIFYLLVIWGGFNTCSSVKRTAPLPDSVCTCLHEWKEAWRNQKYGCKWKYTILLQKDSIKFMIISNYVNDTIDLYSEFFPPLTFQKIILKINNNIKFEKDITPQKYPINFNLFHNNNYLESKIVEIKLITFDGKILFSIDGYGGCATCHQYTQILDSMQNILYENILYYGDDGWVNTWKGDSNIYNAYNHSKCICN